jgi:hypothetical protein
MLLFFVKFSLSLRNIFPLNENLNLLTKVTNSKLSVQTGLWIRIHFFRIRICIQHLRMNTNTDPDPEPIRIQGFNDQKLKKKFS